MAKNIKPMQEAAPVEPPPLAPTLSQEPEQESQSLPEKSPLQEADSGTIDGSHVLNIPLPEEPASVSREVKTSTESAGDGYISKDAFYQSGAAIMDMAGRAKNLKSLPISREEEPQARPAFDALYDTLMDVPYLNMLLKPGSVWAQRAFCILAFAYPKYLGVKAEIDAQRMAARPQSAAAATAPAPSPDAPGGIWDACPAA